jgi:hypothetical protein
MTDQVNMGTITIHGGVVGLYRGEEAGDRCPRGLVQGSVWSVGIVGWSLEHGAWRMAKWRFCAGTRSIARDLALQTHPDTLEHTHTALNQAG